MNEKDIYEILSNMNIEAPNEEVPLSEVEVKRIKKVVKKKLFNNRRKYIIAALLFLSFTFIISPFGKNVIAKIKDKLVFNSSYGIISLEENKELYVLKDSFTVDINGKELLVKSIINNGENLFIQVISKEASVDFKDIASKIAVKLSNGEVKYENNYGASISGIIVIDIGIDIRDTEAKDFTLMYGDNVLKEVSLDSADYKYNYDDIGGNYTNKGILVGGTSYYIEGKRYFKVWSDASILVSKDYDVRIGHIEIKEVRDESGNLLRFEPSSEGTGQEYKIIDNYSGKINVKVEEIDLEYNLKTPTKLKFKDPEKGGDYSVDKTLTFKGIEDEINITEIKKDDKYININFTFSDNALNDRFIYYLTDNSKVSSGMSDREKMLGEISIDYEDLNIYEKLTGNIRIDIRKLDVLQKGSWNFIIE
ncbi:MAG: hypothetical protein E7212_05785 [Clostridium sartagoforme]|nr:hypothetical protein [Clostridium sartagoforme]